MENKTISWRASEFKNYPKNLGWYVTVISISVMVVAFSVIVQSDIFAGVSLALIAIIIVLFSRQTPQIVDIELNSKGVKLGNLSYPYKQLKYFWVVHDPNHLTVNFHTSALINNTLILELEGQDPEMVRQYLRKHLSEHSETEPTAIQKIMHKVKF